jgi:hypothetical protein
VATDPLLDLGQRGLHVLVEALRALGRRGDLRQLGHDRRLVRESGGPALLREQVERQR